MQLRKFFVLVLALCLLCGCAPSPSADSSLSNPSTEPSAEPSKPTDPPEKPTEPPVQPTDPPAEPTNPPTFPMGSTGNATDGVLRCLPLDIGVNCDAHLWGDTVLLYNAHRCQIRSLQDGSVLVSAPGVVTNSATFTDEGIICYSLGKHQIIFRDKSLETVKTVDVSVSSDVADMLFSQDGTKAYYCFNTATIVELDIQTGEKREIPVDGAPIWTLSGLYFEDSILCYWGKEDNQDYYAFVDLETGAYLGKDTTMTRFQCWDNGYYICRAENGSVTRLVVTEGTERYIELQDRETVSYSTWALPQINSFLALSFDYESPVVVLDLYDLATGECTASLTVDLGGEYQNATTVLVDPSGEYIWLCMKVGNTGNYQMGLYRWDFRASAPAE